MFPMRHVERERPRVNWWRRGDGCTLFYRYITNERVFTCLVLYFQIHACTGIVTVCLDLIPLTKLRHTKLYSNRGNLIYVNVAPRTMMSGEEYMNIRWTVRIQRSIKMRARMRYKKKRVA